jgi:hypothetical protein
VQVLVGENWVRGTFYNVRTAMKKILLTSLLTLGALTLSQQQASAWVNVKLGIGFDVSWRCPLWSHFCGHPPCGQECPPYCFEPSFYQPPNPAFWGSPVASGDYFTAGAPAPVFPQALLTPDGHNAYYNSRPPFQTVTYPSYPALPNNYYPAANYYYGR